MVHKFTVNVAQLVEHQIVALGVEGSIPSIHPKEKIFEKRLQTTQKPLYL